MHNSRIRRTTRKLQQALPVSLKGKQRARGQALVEFALVAMIFFLLCFAVIDFSWLMFNQMAMQDAVRESARFAATGNYLSPAGTPLSRVDSIKQVLNQLAMGTNVEQILITNSAGTLGPGGTASAGAPGTIVTVKAVCDIPLFTTTIGSMFGSDNKFHFTVSSSFKNEPFPPAATF
jgi:Flp pilus assembly protein TadG